MISMTRAGMKFVRQEPEWVRIRSGDPSALESVFRAYHLELSDFVYGYVRSREVTADLIHDVFVKLWEGRERLQLRDSLRSYLYTAARNHAMSHLRHALVERQWRERVVRAEPAVSRFDEDAQRRLEDQELAVAVERVLEQLPERCRLALTLRWQRRMSYAEVADVMGISVKTVETYVTRGVAALRDSYERLLPYLE
jgi:RNA polymerase sigma-70 factor (ECF subfamily)